ncbi:PTS sugar transporter subunit IIA [Lacrimispora sp. 210928-DFI.3.58]|uniref:PTS sugar transporter subunit IIA n=1 Tax=Lacrimispora sp. 210928-DFI.3.58 TaxID=2883214 RepID=UPI001D05D492|nr:PTS sugar transporter subunit IIA [Lacrimispora sp. 210928-DFI.3.58]MCB7318461.1 PTS sugar transporter subunit IIA [Lacrimispora sp. 210928-DFI.3.58]
MGIRFDESLILDIRDASSDRDALGRMCDYLRGRGMVKDTYRQAILDREASFPTGLNTGGINIAIPHCDVCNVNEAAICVGLLKPEVDFHTMDEPECAVPVRLVIMLVLTEPHGHLEMLQRIVELIKNQEDVKKIVDTQNMGQAAAIIKQYLLAE